MNNLKDWLGSGLKIKRYLLLVILGTLSLSYGISNLKLYNELSVSNVVVTALLFIIGFVLIVMGFLLAQRRILRALAEANVSSNTRKLNIKKLLFDKKTLDKNVKVVVIGQGEGMATLLNGMKLFSNNITSVVSTFYEKNSNDQLLEIGEVKRAMIALAEKGNNDLEKFFNCNTRYGEDLGTIVFKSMMDINDNNFSKAVYALSNFISMNGKVLPATIDKVTMGAVLSDGTRLHGKKEMIDVPIEKRLPIDRVFITPERCTPAPNVIKSIKEADLIIIGPGSLYTGILPILLIKEIADEIKKSKATKIFVSSLMTEYGQTDGYSLSDYINVIHEHVGKGIFDYCIASDSAVMPEYIRMYNKENSEVIDVDKIKVKNTGVKLVVNDLSIVGENGKIRHDPVKLAKEIIDIMIKNMDLSADKQGLEFYNVDEKMKKVNSKHKKKSVLFRDVKVITGMEKRK